MMMAPNNNNMGGYPNNSGGVGRYPHKCLGCCCDCRRAVMIVNMITGISNGLTLFFAYLYGLSLDTLTFAITVGSIVFAGLGYYGARSFNVAMVAAAAVFLVATLAFSIVGFFTFNSDQIVLDDDTNPFQGNNAIYFTVAPGIILSILFIYPHVVLIRELQTGVWKPYQDAMAAIMIPVYQTQQSPYSPATPVAVAAPVGSGGGGGGDGFVSGFQSSSPPSTGTAPFATARIVETTTTPSAKVTGSMKKSKVDDEMEC